MGMTIDKAILRVEHSYMRVDDKETADFIIDTMRRYQKIADITDNRYGKPVFKTLDEIIKVVEDGKID